MDEVLRELGAEVLVLAGVNTHACIRTVAIDAYQRDLIEAADRLASEDPRLAILLRVVMLGGLRASEARGFAWQSADLNAPSLSVTSAWTAGTRSGQVERRPSVPYRPRGR